MKVTTWRIAEVTQVEVDETSFNVSSIQMDKLIESLRKDGISLHAGASQREIQSPEEFVEFLVQSGIGPDVQVNPITGQIDSISASGGAAICEYDSAEAAEVLESLEASGPPPKMIVGDLAQTSVGLPGSGSEVQVIGLSEWTIDWKRKTADATTTDNSSYESSLPSTASWSVKAKYMYIDQDTSQSTNILATITALQASPTTWNFFPTIAQGRNAFSGMAYVDGITIASGMGKCVGLDVSLKGSGPLNIVAQLAPVANANTVTGQQAEV